MINYTFKKYFKSIDEEVFRDKYLGSYSSFIGSPVYNGELQLVAL